MEEGQKLTDISLLGEADCTLLADNRHLKVHKSLLVSSSTYFAAMFNSGMKDSKLDYIKMEAVDSCSLESIINSLYSGFMKIDETTVDGLLQTASYLSVLSAERLCCDFIMENLVAETSIYYLGLSEDYGCLQLTKDIKTWIAKNLDLVSKVNLSGLSRKNFDALLVRTDLRVSLECQYSLEYIVLKFMQHWLNVNEGQVDNYCDYYSQVHYNVMTGRELEISSRIGHFQTCNGDCRVRLQSALYYYNNTALDPLSNSDRMKSRTAKTCFILQNSDLIAYEINTFRVIKRITLKYKLSPHLLSINNYLFICGGKFRNSDGLSNLFSRYDPIRDAWLSLQHLPEKCTGFVFLHHGVKIYVIGGREVSGVTDKCWAYDIVDNVWSPICSIPQAAKHHTGVVYDNKLYVCGGFLVKGMLRYHIDSDTWIRCSSSFCHRKRHIMAEVANKFYIIGGYNDQLTLVEPVEMYSPEVDQWSMLSINIKVHNSGCFVFEDKIYIVGGFNGKLGEDNIRSFDCKSMTVTTLVDEISYTSHPAYSVLLSFI